MSKVSIDEAIKTLRSQIRSLESRVRDVESSCIAAGHGEDTCTMSDHREILALCERVSAIEKRLGEVEAEPMEPAPEPMYSGQFVGIEQAERWRRIEVAAQALVGLSLYHFACVSSEAIGFRKALRAALES